MYGRFGCRALFNWKILAMRICNIFLFLIFSCYAAFAEENILRIPGSSTAYPFVTTIAQIYSLTHHDQPVIVESTGTGSGLLLFCRGHDPNSPTLVSTSRPITEQEEFQCKNNGVDDLVEVKYGYDGIILANSKQNSVISLTRRELFLALIDKVVIDGELVDNPYQKWSDINQSLPDIKIEVYGPASTSGTRDEFNAIVMEDSCKKIADYNNYHGLCQHIRQDGKYIEIGNNENLIIQKLFKNERAFGIIGYNFYRNNTDRLHAVRVDGVEPNLITIRDGSYVLSRPLLIYGKQKAKDNQAFFDTLLSDEVAGVNGILARKGLVALPSNELQEMRSAVRRRS